MTLLVVHIVCGFFSLVGLASVLRGIAERLADVGDERRYLLVFLQGEDADLRLKSAVERLRSEPQCALGGVVAVDGGLREEVKRACHMVAEESGCAVIHPPEKFQVWLEGILRERDDGTARDGREDHVL